MTTNYIRSVVNRQIIQAVTPTREVIQAIPRSQIEPANIFAVEIKIYISGNGTGKSTHIEQVAARLNWPCIRINLDSHISRIDLIGKDAIVIRDGMQVTEFREGLLPWALQTPTAVTIAWARAASGLRSLAQISRRRAL